MLTHLSSAPHAVLVLGDLAVGADPPLQRELAQENNRKAQLTPAMITADKLNFNYKVSGGTRNSVPPTNSPYGAIVS